ncbi:hypothetical protein [Desulfovermiculus halophilus]|uniref:hypothetical protein n=1 Tax=Desulfovermiculus halophilus TaxID=339722 RepID=UPI001294834D|nr:hypothetical protein [Desulfovermiculus halophilus]
MSRQWMFGCCCALVAAVVMCAAVKAQAKRFSFPEAGFGLQLPAQWVQVPGDVLRKRMESLAQAMEIDTESKRLDYDYALQLESKEWFSYPYILISHREGLRVDSGEIQEMNERVKTSLQKEQPGVSNNELVSAQYDPRRHEYRAETRFRMGETDMVLLKAVWYLNQDVLVASAYLPESMYSRYAPDVLQAMDSLDITPENVYRAEDDSGSTFWEAVLPYSKVIMATVIVLLLVGIYLWRQRSNGS